MPFGSGDRASTVDGRSTCGGRDGRQVRDHRVDLLPGAVTIEVETQDPSLDVGDVEAAGGVDGQPGDPVERCAPLEPFPPDRERRSQRAGCAVEREEDALRFHPGGEGRRGSGGTAEHDVAADDDALEVARLRNRREHARVADLPPRACRGTSTRRRACAVRDPGQRRRSHRGIGHDPTLGARPPRRKSGYPRSLMRRYVPWVSRWASSVREWTPSFLYSRDRLVSTVLGVT